MLSKTQFNTGWQSIPWSTPLPAEAVAIWEEMSRIDHQAPVFTRHEWLGLAAQSGAITPWGIVVIRNEQRVVGLFPLRKSSPWTWEMLSYFAQDNPQMLIDPMREEDALAGLAQWMVKTPAVGALSLGTCSDARRIELFQQVCQRHGLHVIVTPLGISSVHSPLSATWNGFIESLEPSHRKEMLRAERILFRDFTDVRIEHLTDPDACLNALDEMVRMYCCRWGENVGGCIFDDPRNVAFYRAAVRWAAENDFAAVSTLRLRGQLIVVGTKFHIPGQEMMYEQFIVRDTDVLPNRYSPGHVECCHTLRWAMGRGVKTVNQGIGTLSYKLMFNGDPKPLWDVKVIRTPHSGKIWVAADRALHIIQRLPVHARYHLKRLVRNRRW